MLKEMVVAIAGGAGLIGREFTHALLDKGANVIVFDNCPAEIWENNIIAGAEFIAVDITNRHKIIEAIDKTHTKFGKIDSFVNAAYPKNANYGRHFFEVQYEDFVENIGSHLGGYFLAAQVFADYFKKQGYGHIISIASIYGIIAPNFEIYNGTEMTMPVEYAVIKAGVIQMTKYLAKYLKGTQVRVNCISPGGIMDKQPKSFVEAYNRRCLTKGLLDKSDINGTLIYLLSNLSSYVNGQNIVVDDGYAL
jgi:NAD(P)-dependent dehydrogenase (short-subunit alcohol dehydrogenase family)